VVIGERFAWAHLPKAGGDATAVMFAAVPGLVRFADPFNSNDKHMPFFGREEEVAGKLLVMNIRRLPSWSLSAANHKVVHGVFPEYRPLPMMSAAEMAASTEPDDLLRWMTDHGRFSVDRWLRAEELRHDVLALLSELGVLTPDVRAAVPAVGRVNAAGYDRTLPFTADQLRQMYAKNPAWAAIERQVYGDVPG
jgi:hypothetical protein